MAFGSGGSTIKVPLSVELQNLDRVKNQLQNFLTSKIDHKSGYYGKVEAIIQKVVNAQQQLTILQEKPIKNNADIEQRVKILRDLAAAMEGYEKTIQGLKDSDVVFDAKASNSINQYQTHITDLTNSIQDLKNKLKTSQSTFNKDDKDIRKGLKATGDTLLKAGQIKLDSQDGTNTYDALVQDARDNLTRLKQEHDKIKQELQDAQNDLNNNTFGAHMKSLFGSDTNKFENIFWGKSGVPNLKQILKANNVTDLDTVQSIPENDLNKIKDDLVQKLSLTQQDVSAIFANFADPVSALKTLKTVLQNPRTNANVAQLFGQDWNQIQNEINTYDQQKDKAEALAIVESNKNAQVTQMQTWATQAEEAAKKFLKAKNTFMQDETDINNQIAQDETDIKQDKQALDNFVNQYVQDTRQEGSNNGGYSRDVKQTAGDLSAKLSAAQNELLANDERLEIASGIENFVKRYVSTIAILRTALNSIKSAVNNIIELDKTITSIAVVTNMSQEDLWSRVGEYGSIAQQYGVDIGNVYEVSQIFYQQGLQTNEVMDLTVETLKMAKIAGMDYAEAADAMTVALRAFTIASEDAARVTDVYSALAANFAVSTAEIANAMEKTASSAASVGMSLESTSAFMTVMVQTTRESSQNIGSALKSIISRYGEMKASPSSILDIDGEEAAFNKVDTALASIGISIKDSSGQFRDFDDVVMELAKKWDTLDNNTKRYLATIMAGNRFIMLAGTEAA